MTQHISKPLIVVTQPPYWAGGILGLVTILVLLPIPKPQSQQVTALLLAMIAGAYFGFAANDGRQSANLIESVVGLGFGELAFAGLWLEPMLLPVGYFAHGLWDLTHHRHGPLADIPDWWVPYCVIYEWLVGAFLVFWW